MPRTGMRKKSEAARQKMLDAALLVIGQKGYAGATMDDIAKSAGVSKGLVYYHFSNKAKLAAAVIESGLGALVDVLKRTEVGCSSASEALDAMVEVLGDRLYSNKLVTRFVFEEMFRDDRDCSEVMRVYIQTFLQMIENLVERGQAEGAFSSHLDKQFTAVSIFGLVITTSIYYTGSIDKIDQSVQRTALPQAEFSHGLRAQVRAICCA